MADAREPEPTLNALSRAAASEALTRCCGSTRWVQGMLARLPFASHTAHVRGGRRNLGAARPGRLPRSIRASPGNRLESRRIAAKIRQDRGLGRKPSSAPRRAQARPRCRRCATATAPIASASASLHRLRHAARAREEMLALLQARLKHAPDLELGIAAAEQAKITHLRLEKLECMSAITSHVLDTSLGKPAAAVSVSLALLEDGAFVELGRGVTDAGRPRQATARRERAQRRHCTVCASRPAHTTAAPAATRSTSASSSNFTSPIRASTITCRCS